MEKKRSGRVGERSDAPRNLWWGRLSFVFFKVCFRFVGRRALPIGGRHFFPRAALRFHARVTSLRACASVFLYRPETASLQRSDPLSLSFFSSRPESFDSQSPHPRQGRKRRRGRNHKKKGKHDGARLISCASRTRARDSITRIQSLLSTETVHGVEDPRSAGRDARCHPPPVPPDLEARVAVRVSALPRRAKML